MAVYGQRSSCSGILHAELKDNAMKKLFILLCFAVVVAASTVLDSKPDLKAALAAALVFAVFLLFLLRRYLLQNSARKIDLIPGVPAIVFPVMVLLKQNGFLSINYIFIWVIFGVLVIACGGYYFQQTDY